MRRRPDVQRTASTRDRILEAAVRRFSRQSYEETGLRDIAGDVGIDVAYVHRCFGSKEKLFAEALRAAIGSEQNFSGDPRKLAGSLAKRVFGQDGGKRPRGHAGSLDIVARSLTSPKAASVLRTFIVNDFIGPLSAQLGQASLARASVIAALLAGLGILRNVLDVAPLGEAGGGELESLVAGVIRFVAFSPTGRI